MTLADRQRRFDAVLEQLVADPAVSLAALANEDGFLVAAIPDVEFARAAAAIGASFHQLAQRIDPEQAVDQIVVRFDDRRQLVCRWVVCDQAELVLSVVVESGYAFRLLTNRAIRDLCSL